MEFLKEKYLKYIKKKCVGLGCGRKLPGTLEYYEKFGNYCLRCSGIATDKMHNKFYKKYDQK